MDIFFRHSPKLFKKMDKRQAIYYFFLQQHYFSGVAMAISIVLLDIYFFTGLRAANVDLFKFFMSYSIVILVCWLMSVWLQRFNVYKHQEGQLLFAGRIISIAAWPVYFLAYLSILTGKRLSYKVTPKGNIGEVKTSFTVFIPHFIFGAIAFIGIIVSFYTNQQSNGMLVWASSTLLLMVSVPFSVEITSFLQRMRDLLSRIIYSMHKFNSKYSKYINFEVFSTKKVIEQNYRILYGRIKWVWS